MISVGGEKVNWSAVYNTFQNTVNFVNSIYDAIQKYNLDGVDLDIESYTAPPRSVANMIIDLRKRIGQKILILTA